MMGERRKRAGFAYEKGERRFTKSNQIKSMISEF
jgi:hypothetical protein